MTALIFALIKENYVAEQGARMVSMDGASKNAGEMIDKLNLSFNRMRQAVSFFIQNFEKLFHEFFFCSSEVRKLFKRHLVFLEISYNPLT